MVPLLILPSAPSRSPKIIVTWVPAGPESFTVAQPALVASKSYSVVVESKGFVALTGRVPVTRIGSTNWASSSAVGSAATAAPAQEAPSQPGAFQPGCSSRASYVSP